MPQYPCVRCSCNKPTSIKGTRCDDCDDPSGMKAASRDAIKAAEERRGDQSDTSHAGFVTYTRNGVKGKFWVADTRRERSLEGPRRRMEGESSQAGSIGQGEASRRPPGPGTKTWMGKDGRIYSQWRAG